MIYYAGIGSRETPKEILDYFNILGAYFGKLGFTLRSGGANGADKAFEIGCDRVNGLKEIFLPWKGFEGSNSSYYEDRPEAHEIAAQYHPYWHNLSKGARSLQARNSHQVLGWDLDTPSDFIVCWTKNGKGSGGTGQAIRLAKAFNIPVFDAGSYGSLNDVKANLKEFLI